MYIYIYLYVYMYIHTHINIYTLRGTYCLAILEGVSLVCRSPLLRACSFAFTWQSTGVCILHECVFVFVCVCQWSAVDSRGVAHVFSFFFPGFFFPVPKWRVDDYQDFGIDNKYHRRRLLKKINPWVAHSMVLEIRLGWQCFGNFGEKAEDALSVHVSSAKEPLN